MTAIEDWIGSRVAKVATIRPDDVIAKAAQEMRDNRVGALLVVDEQGAAVGIISERDIITRSAAASANPEQMRVADIMTTGLISCSTDTPITKAHLLMVTHGIRHLPIVRDGRPVGMISSRDILAHQLRVNEGMKAAAEKVAMMSRNFKSLEMDEVLGVATSEVPGIFQAKHCLLCVQQDQTGTAGQPLISRNNCPCAEKDLLAREDVLQPSISAEVFSNSVPPVCSGHGCEGPMILIPLAGLEPGDNCGSLQDLRQNFLCMCGLPPNVMASEELLQYRGALVRDILNVYLANARLYLEGRRTGLVDALTGLGTRRALDARIEEECERVARYGGTFCVAMLDADRFKAVNDRHGHAVGDQTLRILAEIIRGNGRANDFPARYGGDEFVVLMPQTKLEDATVAMERLRRQIEQGLFRPNAQSVTISCGIAEWSGRDDDAGAVLRRADSALYEAKRAGRNRVFASAPPAETKQAV